MYAVRNWLDRIGLARSQLVQRIRQLIAERKLTQAKAAELLGLDQPKVSALLRGRVDGYTLDRLFRFLNALGQRVEICVMPNAKDGSLGSPPAGCLWSRKRPESAQPWPV